MKVPRTQPCDCNTLEKISLGDMNRVCFHLLPFGVREKVVWPDIFAKHHVVIEVNELLGESWNAVNVGLNGWGAESRKMALILEDILEV